MRESLTVLARGVLATLLAVLASWLSTATPVLASPPEAPSPATYTYLAPVIVVTPVDHVSERGPPTYAHTAAHRAVNAGSHCASASLCIATPFTTTAYNAPSTLVPAAGSTATTRGHVEVEVGDLSVLPGATVAANTADDVGGMIYRTGSRTDNALTDASGVSFRDSVSSSLSSEHPQVFRPGDKVWAVDTSALPPGAVVRDGVPQGHVSVHATPGEIRGAIVDDPFLGGLGLKPLDEFGSYRLPR